MSTENLNLTINRLFKCDAKTLFNAVAEGVLFKYTGAIMDKTNYEFKVGGKLHIEWGDCPHVDGEFTAIDPYHHVAFTWTHSSEQTQSMVSSKVTIDIIENQGMSTLTLKHDGLQTHEQMAEYYEGWDDALKDLYGSFKDLFAELTNNKSGMDLKFKHRKLIKAPLPVVFQAVKEDKKLMKYFPVDASKSFGPGEEVIWKFEGYEPFTLRVDKYIENEVIKFQWGQAHVAFSFHEKAPGQTMVTIEATGWKSDQASLNDSYSECEGWMDYLIRLKLFVEQGEAVAKMV